MKIAIISPGNFSVPPVVGSSVEHDIDMIARVMKKWHQVIVYTRTCKAYPRSVTEGNLTFRRFPYHSSASYLRRVIRDIKKEKPDVIQVENRPAYISLIRAYFKNIPLVLVMHSKVFASPPIISDRRMKAVMNKVDALITNSHYMKKYYSKKYCRYANKVHAVHLGIDVAPYREAESDGDRIAFLQKKYGLADDNRVLLFAGRLLKSKGVHLLIDSIPKIVKDNPRVKVLITGSPVYGRNIKTPYLKKIYRTAKKYRRYIHFTHFIRPQEMPYIYQLADVVVTPSVWNEPFCRVNLEAMASGKPVITTRRGGIPEVVKHEQTGIVFPLSSWKKTFPHALKELNNERLEEMGKRGLERAQTFTWENTARGYLSVFQTILPKEKIENSVPGSVDNEGINTLCR